MHSSDDLRKIQATAAAGDDEIAAIHA